MEIQINNYDELLEFIKLEEITAKQGTELVCKALKVISLFDMTKEELYMATEYCIDTFYRNNNSERPIFLNQCSLDFDIRDIFQSKKVYKV
jgi:hypothetical protein